MARDLRARNVSLGEGGGRLRYGVPGQEHRIKDHAGKGERFGKLAAQLRAPYILGYLSSRTAKRQDGK